MLRALAVAFTILLAACDTDPIAWNDPQAASAADQSAGLRLTVDSAGAARLVPDSTTPVAPPVLAALCRTSFRTARGSTRLYGAWWAVRRDSSAVLYAASSTDGGNTWGTPSAVDTLDVSSRGCDRPAPALATSGDDLHTAYSMIAPEGTGVFFAHFMGSMLHSPVVVIYGERLVATAIAAQGDRVAVAYEEPNGSRQQVDVSVSLTQGHIFERHSVASRSIDAASAPAIAMSGSNIAVAWTTRRQTDSTGTRVIRTGRLK
jgi:hypothetical protein